MFFNFILQQYSRDDSSLKEDNVQITCETSPPNTPRSLRLERLQSALNNSGGEDSPRYVKLR